MNSYNELKKENTLILKTEKINEIIISCGILFLITSAIVWREDKMLVLIFLVPMILLIRCWIAEGRTIIMCESGCTVVFLWFKKTYRWNEFQFRGYENHIYAGAYKISYKKGVYFSQKEITKPKWIHPVMYSIFIHPFSFIFVFFTDDKNTKKVQKIYEIEENIFMEKMKEWQVNLKNI